MLIEPKNDALEVHAISLTHWVQVLHAGCRTFGKPCDESTIEAFFVVAGALRATEEEFRATVVFCLTEGDGEFPSTALFAERLRRLRRDADTVNIWHEQVNGAARSLPRTGNWRVEQSDEQKRQWADLRHVARVRLGIEGDEPDTPGRGPIESATNVNGAKREEDETKAIKEES